VSCGKYTTDYWVDLLSQHVDDPSWVPYCSRWIAEETDGCPAGLGQVTEVGIFQLDLQDGPKWGATVDTLHGNFSVSPSSQSLARDLTPDEETLQVTTGLTFIRWVRQHNQANLDHLGISWSDDELWAFTKLYHALPRLTDNYLDAAHNVGATSSWSDFAAYLRGLSKDDAAGINSAVAAKYWPFGKYVDNAEAVGFGGANPSDFLSFDVGSTLVVLLALAAAAYWLQHHSHAV